jgi:diguanylate cyclase (GGDEF)-like protein
MKTYVIQHFRWLSRFASIGLALVFLALTGFSIWAAIMTHSAVSHASRAISLNEMVDQSRYAMSVERVAVESYRNTPSAQSLTTYYAASTSVINILFTLSHDGDAKDAALAQQVLDLHWSYLVNVDQVFQGVNAGDTVQTLAADHRSTVIYNQMKQLISQAAAQHQQQAMIALTELTTLQHTLFLATPIIFAVGMALICLFGMLLRLYQRSIDLEKQAEMARLAQAAVTDTLTGLGNHRAYENDIHTLFEHGQHLEGSVSLALINVDELKHINDAQGHLFGDQILQELAHLLGQIGASEGAYRLGGDLFAVLWNTGSPHEIVENMERLQQQVQHRLLGATISLGLAATQEDENSPDILREQAEAALHEAKRRGRQTMVVYDDIRTSTTILAPATVQAFRRLLAEQHITVAFQPIWNLEQNTLLSFEALSRPDPSYGFSGPQEVFDIAEQLGYAPTLDALCIRRIFERVNDLPMDCLLFVNLTPQSLAHDLLTSSALVEAVVTAGLTPERVVLELTERSIIRLPVLVEKVKHLHLLGFRLALDDTGAGNAGLELLRQVPVDFIKIDRAAIANALTDKAAHGILTGIIAIAREMDAFVIAEGIETMEELALVRKVGVQGGQGYLLGRPGEQFPARSTLGVDRPFAHAS